MNGFAELRLQVANDQIRRFHAEADTQRLARSASQPSATSSRRSVGAAFGRSLRVLGLAH